MKRQLPKKKKFNWWRPLAGSCVVGFLVWWNATPPPHVQTNSLQNNRVPASFPSPQEVIARDFDLKASRTETQTVKARLKTIKGETETLISSLKQHDAKLQVSVFFRDFRTRETLGLNQDQEYRLGSLIKIPVLIASLRMLETHPDIAKMNFKYEKEKVPPGGKWDLPFYHPSPERGLKDGETYTFDELFYKMIVLSGNRALEVLVNLAHKEFEQLYVDLHIPVPNYDAPMRSPATMSQYFETLFNASYLSEESSRKALGFLLRSEFHAGLEVALPPGVAIAHKFGVFENIEGERDLHECGIVYSPGHPYSLCVFVKGSDFTLDSEILQGVSKIFYRGLNPQP